MSDKKNLDRLFQEKLQNFEQDPRPDVWGQIQDRMQEKKKRKVRKESESIYQWHSQIDSFFYQQMKLLKKKLFWLQIL